MLIDHALLQEALALARRGMHSGGGPFGAVIAKEGKIVATGMNESRALNDPTAHAEIMAIRAAGHALGRRTLADCILYCSCEPCPMCLAACYWARLSHIVYAATAADAAAAGYDDAMILAELRRDPSERRIRATAVLRSEGLRVFDEWRSLQSSNAS